MWNEAQPCEVNQFRSQVKTSQLKYILLLCCAATIRGRTIEFGEVACDRARRRRCCNWHACCVFDGVQSFRNVLASSPTSRMRSFNSYLANANIDSFAFRIHVFGAGRKCNRSAHASCACDQSPRIGNPDLLCHSRQLVVAASLMGIK